MFDGTAMIGTFAADFGFAYSFQNDYPNFAWDLRAGITLQNIGSDIYYEEYDQERKLPQVLRMGLSYSFTKKSNDKPVLKVTPQFEYQVGLVSNGGGDEWSEYPKSIGIDISFFEILSLRAGYLMAYDYYCDYYFGTGTDNDRSEWKSTDDYALGFGLNISEILVKLNGIKGEFPASIMLDFGCVPEKNHVRNGPLPFSISFVSSFDFSK
ncbi:hypothetical protein JXI42_09500 [bacterium]|nr:hypothetical protein [bacterium]